MSRIGMFCLALLAVACGNKDKPYAPDLTTFEGAVEAYVRAIEDGKASYAGDVFTPAEREAQLKTLEGDIAKAAESKIKFKILATEAAPLAGPEERYVVLMTRLQSAAENTEFAKPSAIWLVFVKEADGNWRINWTQSKRHMQSLNEERARRAQQPANQPANNGG